MFSTAVSPFGLMGRDSNDASTCSDGSSYAALRATEVSKKCNLQMRERGTGFLHTRSLAHASGYERLRKLRLHCYP
jgi:hypothetical protein